MRTGVQYFPKGVAPIDRNRHRISLNKIEETTGEGRNAASYSNSLKSGNAYIEHPAAVSITSNTNIPCKGVKECLLEDKSTFTSQIIQKRLSPGLQANMCYQSFRGFECKWDFFTCKPESI